MTKTLTPKQEDFLQALLGEPLRKVVKYKDGNFKQFKWQQGDWIANVKGIPNIPYQLPELVENCSDRPVFLMEG